MGRVIHFEISVSDTKKVIEFYTKVFGWKAENVDGGGMEYWLVRTGEGGGIDGAIMPLMGDFPPTVNTIAVDNLEDAIKKVEAAGGKRVSNKEQIPNVGWFCYCKDPEGNRFGILQPTGMM